jgi:AmpE protein
MLLLIIAIWTIVHFASPSFLFFLYVPVLLYSLGRGNFLAEINVYIDLAKRGDNVAAAKWVDDLCGHAAADLHVKETTQWQELHAQALKVISYRGFERTFAVLFWFVIAGAVGALLYRLSVIYREQTQEGSMEAQLANKWLWLIEFPAVRLMGATWAFVGNFDGHALNTSLLDSEHTSMQILNNQLRSALSAPTDLYPTEQPLFENASVEEMAETAEELADAQEEAEENSQEVIEDLSGITLTSQVEPAYSFALVKSSLPLYQRSLLFWIGAIAFATLFIN